MPDRFCDARTSWCGVDHNWRAGFLCEQENLARSDRIPNQVFPEPFSVERWFNETDASVQVDVGAVRTFALRECRAEVLISKAAVVFQALEFY